MSEEKENQHNHDPMIPSMSNHFEVLAFNAACQSSSLRHPRLFDIKSTQHVPSRHSPLLPEAEDAHAHSCLSYNPSRPSRSPLSVLSSLPNTEARLVLITLHREEERPVQHFTCKSPTVRRENVTVLKVVSEHGSWKAIYARVHACKCLLSLLLYSFVTAQPGLSPHS